jgi:two-component system, sensor histidine kinase
VGPRVILPSEVSSTMANDPGQKILVVDDNDDIREMLAMLLGMLGYRIVVARDGEEAVVVAAAERPDVVLMDVMMPRVNGVEAAHRIRQQPGLTGVPIIGLSAFTDPPACTADFTPITWTAYLRKPIDMDELERLLRFTLSH